MLGHNNPPPRETAISAMNDLLAPFSERRDQFIAAAQRQKVRSREEAADAADILKLSGEVWVDIAQKRLDVSNPYREAHAAAIAKAGSFWEDCEAAMKDLRRRVKVFWNEESSRVAAQQREQEAEEQRLLKGSSEAAAAPVIDITVPKPAPIVGDYGGRVMADERKTYAVEDVQLVPLFILQSPKVTRAICDVAKDIAKHMIEIPGIRIETVHGSKVI